MSQPKISLSGGEIIKSKSPGPIESQTIRTLIRNCTFTFFHCSFTRERQSWIERDSQILYKMNHEITLRSFKTNQKRDIEARRRNSNTTSIPPLWSTRKWSSILLSIINGREAVGYTNMKQLPFRRRAKMLSWRMWYFFLVFLVVAEKSAGNCKLMLLFAAWIWFVVFFSRKNIKKTEILF